MNANLSWWRYGIAILVLQCALVLPHWPGNLLLLWLVRIPVELPIIILVLSLTSGVLQRYLSAIAAVALALLTMLKLANLAAYTGFARPFNILVDPSLLGVALQTLSQSQGIAAGVGAVALVLAVIVAIAAGMWWATSIMASAGWAQTKVHGLTTAGALLIGAVVFQDTKIASAWWPVTSFETSRFAAERTFSIVEGLRNDAQFRDEMAKDSLHTIASERLLAGLKDTDVLLVFAESYGRVAFDDPAQAATLRTTLQEFEAELLKKGFAARSAWLTSPTFGGQSWLAHGTFLSGLWLDNQYRYDSLFIRKHDTLISDFRRAGWRTVAVMPQITMAWPEATFFGYDKVYTAPDLNYAGQGFDYMTMPDQYTLATFDTRELSPQGRPAIMAEIGLVSSHIPWTPVPRLVSWAEVGDGKIFDVARSAAGDVDWLNQAQLQQDYTKSIDYVLRTLMSYLTTRVKKNTLMIIVGDHQPVTLVSGQSATHDVPIHMIASNPEVLAAISDWHWTVGMVPNESSPNWRMDTIRERMLSTFTPATETSSATGVGQ